MGIEPEAGIGELGHGGAPDDNGAGPSQPGNGEGVIEGGRRVLEQD